MHQSNQKRVRLLAETERKPDPRRTMHEHAVRTALLAAYFAMVRGVNRTKLGSRRWHFDDAAPNVAKRNPLGDLYADGLAVKAAGGSEADVCAPFEALAEAMHAEFRTVSLPSVPLLEIAETEEQGQADVAVRRYLNEPAESDRKRELLDTAIRNLCEHRTALTALEAKLREDRVLLLHPRPALMRSTARDTDTSRTMEPRRA